MDIKDVQEQAFARGYEAGRREALEELLPRLRDVVLREGVALEQVVEDLLYCSTENPCKRCRRYNSSDTYVKCVNGLMLDAAAVIKALLCEGAEKPVAACTGASGGRLRALPAADAASNKEWQRSKFGERSEQQILGTATGTSRSTMCNVGVPARDCHVANAPRNDNTEGAEDTNVPTNGVKEKLVELLSFNPCHGICNFCERFKDNYACEKHKKEAIADNMIAHGVTVQERKPLESFLHPIDAYKGLKAKYLVFKADTGEMVENCFVLRPDKDSAAVEALRAYASTTDNETLAEDIYNWVGKGVTVQEWISVKERLPFAEYGESDDVLAITELGMMRTLYFDGGNWCFQSGECCPHKVTHWMPLPEPPKGE